MVFFLSRMRDSHRVCTVLSFLTLLPLSTSSTNHCGPQSVPNRILQQNTIFFSFFHPIFFTNIFPALNLLSLDQQKRHPRTLFFLPIFLLLEQASKEYTQFPPAPKMPVVASRCCQTTPMCSLLQLCAFSLCSPQQTKKKRKSTTLVLLLLSPFLIHSPNTSFIASSFLYLFSPFFFFGMVAVEVDTHSCFSFSLLRTLLSFLGMANVLLLFDINPLLSIVFPHVHFPKDRSRANNCMSAAEKKSSIKLHVDVPQNKWLPVSSIAVFTPISFLKNFSFFQIFELFQKGLEFLLRLHNEGKKK